METKVCKKCNSEQPIINFSKNKECKDGHIGSCRNCEKLQVLKRIEIIGIDEFRARGRARLNKSREKNREHYNALHRGYNLKRKNNPITLKKRKEYERGKGRQIILDKSRRYKDNLHNVYIKDQLCGGYNISRKIVPNELIEIYRDYLQLTRKIKSLKHGTKSI